LVQRVADGFSVISGIFDVLLSLRGISGFQMVAVIVRTGTVTYAWLISPTVSAANQSGKGGVSC
jgi:hypothetical protein